MDIGRTEKQFEHRCQTFARAGNDTRDLLLEYFDMRSDTEQLTPGTMPRSGTTSGRKPRSRITDDQRRALWGSPSTSRTSLVHKYDQWKGRPYARSHQYNRKWVLPGGLAGSIGR